MIHLGMIAVGDHTTITTIASSEQLEQLVESSKIFCEMRGSSSIERFVKGLIFEGEISDPRIISSNVFDS